MTTQTMAARGGKGMNHGLVSELTAFFDVKPGHEQELREACQAFNEMLVKALETKKDVIRRIGLRDMRHAIFDDGKRVLWITAFETEWDPYIDDALLLIGIDKWMGWLRHTTYYRESLDTADNATVKRWLQEGQVRATSFFNSLPNQTMPEVERALRLQEAFQTVLDNPAAEQALQAPALKPLLDLAAE